MILTFFTESAKINTMHNNFLENLPIILHNFQKIVFINTDFDGRLLSNMRLVKNRYDKPLQSFFFGGILT